MKKDNFDDMLTEALKEYVKDEESRSIEVPKVEFSKRHEKNMRKLFESVTDGTFTYFEDSEEKDDLECEKVEFKNTKSIYIKHIKVAVFVLLGLLASLAIAPTMSAWRKGELDFYGEDMDEYAWGLRVDKAEILEVPRNNVDEYIDKFGYLPEEFEITKNIKNQMWIYIEFKDKNNNQIEVKLTKKLNGAIDMDQSHYEKRYINSLEIAYIEKEEENMAIWYVDQIEYRLYGNIVWNEMAKIISNIKYEKFEENF